MLSPRQTQKDGGDIALNYQHYKKWQQRRAEVKERMKEKLNESLSPFKKLDAPLAHTPHHRQDNAAISQPASSHKKTLSIKDRIKEMTDRTPKTSAPTTTRAKMDMNTTFRGKAAEENPQRKFDDLLNNYFSALPTALSPTKDSVAISVATTRSQKLIKDMMGSFRAGPQSPPKQETGRPRLAAIHGSQAPVADLPRQNSLRTRKPAETCRLDEIWARPKTSAKPETEKQTLSSGSVFIR